MKSLPGGVRESRATVRADELDSRGLRAEEYVRWRDRRVILVLRDNFYLMSPMTDKFDLLILAELQQDVRLPTPELAHRVGLSAPACYRRVRALRESGLIEREAALVAPATMGWPITMLVLVTLERGSRPHRR